MKSLDLKLRSRVNKTNVLFFLVYLFSQADLFALPFLFHPLRTGWFRAGVWTLCLFAEGPVINRESSADTGDLIGPISYGGRGEKLCNYCDAGTERGFSRFRCGFEILPWRADQRKTSSRAHAASFDLPRKTDCRVRAADDGKINKSEVFLLRAATWHEQSLQNAFRGSDKDDVKS